MAAEDGGAAPSLAELLYAEIYAFDFFQAVRLLERMGAKARHVGYDGPPATEADWRALVDKTLHFSVKVRQVREATKVELEHRHAHAPGHDH